MVEPPVDIDDGAVSRVAIVAVGIAHRKSQAVNITQPPADRPLARQMRDQAVSLANAYRWSITAARLRRLYADLTARQLVECR